MFCKGIFHWEINNPKEETLHILTLRATNHTETCHSIISVQISIYAPPKFLLKHICTILFKLFLWWQNLTSLFVKVVLLNTVLEKISDQFRVMASKCAYILLSSNLSKLFIVLKTSVQSLLGLVSQEKGDLVLSPLLIMYWQNLFVITDKSLLNFLSSLH